jgi:hypothetical protein
MLRFIFDEYRAPEPTSEHDDDPAIFAMPKPNDVV